MYGFLLREPGGTSLVFGYTSIKYICIIIELLDHEDRARILHEHEVDLGSLDIYHHSLLDSGPHLCERDASLQLHFNCVFRTIRFFIYIRYFWRYVTVSEMG